MKMKQHQRIPTILLLVLLLSGIHQVRLQLNEQSCYDGEGVPTRCESIQQSFSFEKQPSTNSTCGSPPSNFCIRSVSLGQISSDCTAVCDANSLTDSHPPEFMTDFVIFNTWWQSENSLATRNPVVIDVPLGTLVEVEVITFTFQSLVPSAFLIMKSLDYGQTYSDFQYFAISCIDEFSVRDDLMLSLENETTVLCQSITAPPLPRQISFFARLGRPSTNDSIPGFSEELHQFMTATDIRVVLLEHYAIPNLDPDDLGYYYALRDLNVLGSCQCHGHASECRVDESGSYSCVCQHNTTGTFCERCSGFYQDVPWQRHTGAAPFECRECFCNGQSDECRFDPDVYEETNRTSGGVCLNCRDNRAGRHCERCRDFFYPVYNTDISFSCVACGCDLAGVTDDGDCARDLTIEGVSVGDCSCKANTQGRTCDQCRPGFFNLSRDNDLGCQACACSTNGSVSDVCDQVTGSCGCKPNVIGENCDRCRPGFYLPDPVSDQGCVPCNCNIGGSIDQQCDLQTGACSCREGVTGTTCSEVEENFFFRHVDYLLLEAENSTGAPSPVTVTDRQMRLFTGTGFYGVVDGMSEANLGTLTPPVSGLYEGVIRYSLSGAVRWNSSILTVLALDEGVGGGEESGPAVSCGDVPEITDSLVLNYTNYIMGVGMALYRTLCLRGGQTYQFILSDFESGQSDDSAVLNLDSFVLIPVDAQQLATLGDPVTSRDYRECVDFYRSLAGQQSTPPSSCEQTIFKVSTEIYNGAAACDCNVIGSVMGSTCAAFGGQCRCLPGVRGRQCDVCFPGFYNLTSSGCSNCSCHSLGSVGPLCDPLSGDCECVENVGGRDCSSCVPDFWGFQTPQGCSACNCNSTGSLMSQCAEATGECFCRDGVIGEFCDRCQNLTYGFSVNGCSPCSCDLIGSTEERCDLLSGQCSCVGTTTGRDCSQCQEGTFNLQQANPDGCQPCFCSGQSDNCTSAPEFYYVMVSSVFNSSAADPLQGWTATNTNSTVSLVTVAPPSGFGAEGVIIEANSDAYLEAPASFIGNKLSSYAQFLRVNLEPVNSSSYDIESTLEHDVILVGGGDLEIGASLSRTDSGFRVQLHESAGWVHLDTRSSSTPREFQLILSSLSRLLVSASYSTDIVLSSITMNTTSRLSEEEAEAASLLEANSVEMCTCPVNYTGLSCEQCSPGYTRMPAGTCELCQCNGRSSDCDPVTGDCQNCSESTAGPSCDVCARGTFGDPLRDIECLPCPCPLTSRPGQFSDECVLLENGDVSCLNCPLGHTGTQCESCISGYFGDPRGELGTPTICSDCGCNENIDTTDPSSCNRLNGTCTRCLFNTTGDQCERCADGFYGDAIEAKNCTECGCDPRGSSSLLCDATGQCECHSNITGRQCDRCLPGFFGLELTTSTCMPCDCHPLGAEGVECDETGACTCKGGVTGRSCDRCDSGFFGLSENGCEACSCSVNNSDSSVCDTEDGTCRCIAGATGSDCSSCLLNFFQTSSSGCITCPECYDDVEALFNATLMRANEEEAQFQAIMATLSDSNLGEPFDDRLLQYQSNISELIANVTDTAERQNELEQRYNGFLTSINVTLRGNVMQINSSLDELRRRFTTIYVTALTTQELMNTTVMEFITGSSVVQRIEQVILPSITNLSRSIQESAAGANVTARDLESLFNNFTAQVQELRNATYEILSLASSALSDAELVSSLQPQLVQDIEAITAVYLSIDGQVANIDQELTLSEMNVSRLLSDLSAKQESLIETPDPNKVDDLIQSASATEAFVRSDVLGEIASQSSRLSELNETYTSQQAEFEALFEEVTELGMNISRLLAEAQDAQRVAENIQEEAQSLIEQAEMIADNLETFNNETFRIGEEVAAVMGEVNELSENATAALAEAQRIEDVVRNMSDTIRRAKELAVEAQNVTYEANQTLSTVDSGSLVASINGSLQSILSAMATITSISESTSSIMATLEMLNEDLAEREEEVGVVAALNNQTASDLSEGRDAVDEVRQALSNIEVVDEADLEQVRQLLSVARDDLNAADLLGIYEMFRSRLAAQRALREELERELGEMVEDIEHLRRINMALPTGGCNMGGD